MGGYFKNLLKHILPPPVNTFHREIAKVLSAVQACKREIGRQRNEVRRLEEEMIRSMPRADLSFQLALAEHCDLNCFSCGHFSPLAEPELADFHVLSRDFSRLAELFQRKSVSKIEIMGGEPLLHPDIIKIFKMTREKFPKTNIHLVTNGLKLPMQPEAFWHACRDNHIVLRPTKYPISLDYDAIEAKAKQYQVEYWYYGGGKVLKTSNQYPLDVKGLQNGRRNYLHCFRANECIYLENGRLYPCPVASTARHFNRYFSMNLVLCKDDSINIYETDSAEEILDFLAKPIPFCRYCMIDQYKFGMPWCQSKRDIKEWTL